MIKDDKLVGACLYGDTVDGSWYFKLLRDGRSIGDLRDKLMFGESSIGDTGHEGHTKAASMPERMGPKTGLSMSGRSTPTSFERPVRKLAAMASRR